MRRTAPQGNTPQNGAPVANGPRGAVPTSHLTVWVDGIPAPQGSKTAIARGGRAHVIEGGSTTGRRKLKDWRAAVTTTLIPFAGTDPIEGAVEIRIEFHMPMLKAKPRHTQHAVKPDIDKLLRSTFDAISDAGIWRDDSRVAAVTASKCRSTRTGALITIRPIEEVPHESH